MIKILRIFLVIYVAINFLDGAKTAALNGRCTDDDLGRYAPGKILSCYLYARDN
jgi:hypothetical protein